ncbi:hypothetical protein NQ318_015189 [Aromia moschata]|uniref:Uncharacterized protein n=1 Tax=Aromia moschata TaxID=1265417 RepID=A0AAV8XJN5_9CUCU|nr:hypothetical protein NQ318_015189 [Aromia moschata]
MLLAMSGVPPRKPQRLCDRVIKFPKILECDNIELDSLEGCPLEDDSVSLLMELKQKDLEVKRVEF